MPKNKKVTVTTSPILVPTMVQGMPVNRVWVTLSNQTSQTLTAMVSGFKFHTITRSKLKLVTPKVNKAPIKVLFPPKPIVLKPNTAATLIAPISNKPGNPRTQTGIILKVSGDILTPESPSVRQGILLSVVVGNSTNGTKLTVADIWYPPFNTFSK